MWQKATRWKRLLAFATCAPIDWLLGLIFLVSELAFRFVRRLRPLPVPSFTTPAPECSFVVVSWNGKDLLSESLPALVEAVRSHGGNHEIIVVDNGSVDQTVEYIQSQFPEVRLVKSQVNCFFSGGNSLGVQAATRDILVLLNNDMVVSRDFIAPLLEPFADADVFGVGSRIVLPPDRAQEETGKTRIRFNGYDFDWRHDAVTSTDKRKRFVPVLWLHGGAAAMDRRKYLWLGGLDQLYDPFYVEDADLSYRAWKVGWRCLLAVESQALHRHRASTSRFGEDFIRKTVLRNHYIFLWKNVTDLRLLAMHFGRCARMKARRAGIVGVGVRRQLEAWLEAVKRVPAILGRRYRLGRHKLRSDKEILATIASSDCDPEWPPGNASPRPRVGSETLVS